MKKNNNLRVNFIILSLVLVLNVSANSLKFPMLKQLTMLRHRLSFTSWQIKKAIKKIKKIDNERRFIKQDKFTRRFGKETEAEERYLDEKP